MSKQHEDAAALLLAALRQYRHNNSDAFVTGYDKPTVDRLVAGLLSRLAGKDAEVTHVDQLGAEADCPLCYDVGHVPMDDPCDGPPTTSPCPLCKPPAPTAVIQEVIASMRARKVNNGRSTSATLNAWADRLEAALPRLAKAAQPQYPQVRMVRAHKHTCANVKPGSTADDKCDCGAVVDGVSVAAQEKPKPRRTLLAQAESFGAYLTGAPDGSFPVTFVFPIESWRKFDAHLLASSAPQWLPIETAPKDGTLLRLLVDFERHATEDSAGPAHTIGANSYLNDGEDVWKFSGWDWGCDCFTEGEGVPVGWLPLHAPSFEQAQPALTVWEGTMPESNGKTNFTAVLMRRDAKGLEGFTEGFTIQISEYPDRVRYEADRVRYLIGELDEAPDILAYDPDKHSGYVRPTKEKP